MDSRVKDDEPEVPPAGSKTVLREGRTHVSSITAREERYESLKGSVIMMVDDEPTTLDVLELFLQGEGYVKLVKTTDSTHALERVRSEKPDVLLLDLMMPHVSGLDLLTAIRGDEDLERLPVIILTSSTESETKLRALELGATDFLAKPVDPSELALRLRNTLAAKSYQDHLTYYDGLTGLPNRRLFLECLDRSLGRAGAASGYAVLRLTVDRFEQINEALGHRVGNALIGEVAARFERGMNSVDDLDLLGPNGGSSPLSHGGGDEFLVCVAGGSTVNRAARLARRLLVALAPPFRIEGHDLSVTASIGIALSPKDGDEAETLIAHAGIAMVRARRGGGNDYHYYSSEFKAESMERLRLENDLRKAAGRDELSVHYQPKFDLRTGKPVGAEALMRWSHPELGLVPPTRFIPIAEESGVIESLGDWMIAAVCRQSREWRAAGGDPLPVAVNVSIRQFRTGRLPHTIRSCLGENGLSGYDLVLEVTESLLIEDPDRTVEMLHEIKDLGVRISVDDFGTGYSSLSYLKRLPLDELKIDRAFVSAIPDDADGVAIVGAIIAMAHSLGLVVVAEGIENDAQRTFLAERGCDLGQGFLLGRPLPPREWALRFGGDRRDCGPFDEV